MIQTDILVIGSGIAGLCAALEAARSGKKVLVACKGNACASSEVMGFNAPVHGDDSEALFYADTMKSGEEINRSELVRTLSKESVKRIPYMEELGLVFDKNPDGTYNGMQALGNSYPRIVHHMGVTGIKSMELLLTECRHQGVSFKENFRVCDLLVCGQRVYGAVGYERESGSWTPIAAEAVILATGGCGAIHAVSTYPPGMTGDGYAMAYRAGAELVDMEFMQFEPCCFVYPGQLAGRIIVTTMLNEGGKLLNGQGREFMLDTPGGYKVQKGELSREIAKEIARGNGTSHGGVFFDVTALPEKRVNVDCSLFSGPARAAGIDMTKEACEVAPAAHTFLGGVAINGTCETTVQGLFAAGEVTGGLHGANRLGGNAGAEIYTFGVIAGRSAAAYSRNEGPDLKRAESLACEYCSRSGIQTDPEDKEAVKRLQYVIGESLGIFRDEQTMRKAFRDIEKIEKAFLCRGITIKNMILITKLQLMSSLERKESRGVFYRTDYPEKQDNSWKKNIYIRQSGKESAMDIRDAL